MNLRTATTLLFTLALAACATKAPLPIAPTQAERDAVFADDYTCTRDQSAAVDFDTVVKTPERYYNKCIRLRALITGMEIVRDANSLKDSSDGIEAIGLYPKDEKVLALSSIERPQFAEVVGRLRSCDERSEILSSLNARAQAAVAVVRRAPPRCDR